MSSPFFMSNLSTYFARPKKIITLNRFRLEVFLLISLQSTTYENQTIKSEENNIKYWQFLGWC